MLRPEFLHFLCHGGHGDLLDGQTRDGLQPRMEAPPAAPDRSLSDLSAPWRARRGRATHRLRAARPPWRGADLSRRAVLPPPGLSAAHGANLCLTSVSRRTPPSTAPPAPP